MNIKPLSLRAAIATTASLSVFLSTTVTAADDDKIKNMSQLTCAEFLDMGRMQKIMSVVWLSGWTSKEQERYLFAPDRGLLSNKEELLKDNCKNNEGDLVLNQVPDWEY